MQNIDLMSYIMKAMRSAGVGNMRFQLGAIFMKLLWALSYLIPRLILLLQVRVGLLKHHMLIIILNTLIALKE